MLSLPPQVRVFLCTQPTDMRKGFDGLCGLVGEVFDQDVLSGHLFVFVNRRRDRVKLLAWDRDGLSIWYKRLESGTFQLPARRRPKAQRRNRASSSFNASQQAHAIELDAAELSMLLAGIDLTSARRRKRYRRVG